MNPETWFAFLVASVVISVSPGAGAVNTMSNGLRYGVLHTLPAIAGLQVGLAIQFLVVGLGLGAVLASSTLLFSWVKWLGVAYLVWLGIQKWRQPPLDISGDQPIERETSRRFWQAVLVNVTNPKATVFLVALLPQFLDLARSQEVQVLIMALTGISVDILVMLGYASLATQLARWLRHERHQKRMNQLFGGMFITAGGLMATYQR
jgi:homoserine/homoserine lactone efflux protein